MSNNLQYVWTDEMLLSSLAMGDSKAISFLYKTVYPSVEKMVFKMKGSTDDAFDVFQDAVTILYEKSKSNEMQLTCKISTYLISVAKHLWLKKLSKNKQIVSVWYDNSDDNIHVADDISHFDEFEMKVEKLKTSFEQIGEPCKSVLTAFYIQNKNMNEIAEMFGYTNAENAKTQKYKCLNRIRKLFFTEKEKNTSNERLIK